MAAPHVAGIISYLYTLDGAIPAPTLDDNFVLDLLLGSSVEVFDARNRVDAFAAALLVWPCAMGSAPRLHSLEPADRGPRGPFRFSLQRAPATRHRTGPSTEDVAWLVIVGRTDGPPVSRVGGAHHARRPAARTARR